MSGKAVRQYARMSCAGILLAMLCGIGGCSGSGSGTQPSGKKEPAKKADVVVWHWMSDRDAVFQELAKQYEGQTGQVVDFQLFAPSEAYSNKVRASAQTKTLPDIFGILAETRDFASFIKAGFVENLTPAMEADNSQWKKAFFEKALAMETFVEGNQFNVNPGIYGVPIDVMNIQFFYNKDLFAQAGLDPEKPPLTFEEFIAVGKKLKAANIQGLVSGWSEIWMINCLADNFAWNLMGRDKITATLKGDVPYSDPDWIRVFSLFKEMQDAGVLATGMITMVNKHAEQTFANGKAAIAFNGTWGVNVYRGMNPKLNYGVFLPPKISDKYPVAVWGGAGSSFKINALSAQKEKALQFLRWMTEVPQQKLLADKTMNLPSNKESAADIIPALKQFSAAMEYAVHPSQLPYSEFPRVVEAMGKGIQLIIIGSKTTQELAAELVALKQEEMKRLEAKKAAGK
ncbi:MAG: extracellular solute-binding protein [Candidatus Omnitrophica bacterium]|nr:extracellular solute-binding protein [Candidatus Omnitrophota bacterium]